jgi:signal peptidase II
LPSHAVVLGLVCGGALGNVVDRLFREDGWMRGGVVDFIDLQWFPVFNLADSAITLGAVAIVLAGLMPRR